jgi:hypothetical protein
MELLFLNMVDTVFMNAVQLHCVDFSKTSILVLLFFFIIDIFIFQVQYIRTTVLYIIKCATIESWKLF